MYRCIAKLEIDLEGLGEFYSDVSELTMYQIISAWLQDDLDGPNPKNGVRCIRVCLRLDVCITWRYFLSQSI